ncbi:hypothetical protein D3C81_1918470 [compost metagenome]
MAVRVKTCMGHTPHMPQLGENRTSCAMDRICYQTPSRHLFSRMNAWCPGVTLPLGRNLCCFGDDKTGGRALLIILGHKRARNITGLDSTGTSHRCHDNTVF